MKIGVYINANRHKANLRCERDVSPNSRTELCPLGDMYGARCLAFPDDRRRADIDSERGQSILFYGGLQ